MSCGRRNNLHKLFNGFSQYLDSMVTYEEGEEFLGEKGLIVINLSQKLEDFFEDEELYTPHYLCLNAREVDELPNIFFTDFKSRTFREKYEDFSLEERQVAGYKFFKDLFEIPVLVFIKNKETDEWNYLKISDDLEAEASILKEGKKPLYYFKLENLEKI